MDVHIDDMFIFAFHFAWLAGVGLRDLLLQGLAVAVAGLQAVTTIQAYWFKSNQALPAALTRLTTPPFRALSGRSSSSSSRLFLEGIIGSSCCRCGRCWRCVVRRGIVWRGVVWRGAAFTCCVDSG